MYMAENPLHCKDFGEVNFSESESHNLCSVFREDIAF